MKFVVDYTPAIRQTAGIGRIIRGQIQALIEAATDDRLSLFVAGTVSDEDRLRAPLPLHTFPGISERNLVRIWHRLNLPAPRIEWLTGGGIDLFHATDFVLAPVSARRKLVTVHDLAFLRYPQTSMPSLHRYLNVVVPRSIQRADHIIADSFHTAQDLQELWKLPAEKVSVVQGAVDHSFFSRIQDEPRLQTVRRKYGIGPAPFILGLSTLQPRKNFARLIQAFHIARQEAALPHKLVIGGKKGWLFAEIFALVQKLNLEDEVIFPGFVDDADLPALYSACEFFAFPSLYEGFGLPILEALACGTPVLAGDNSCLPEAGGPGAYYVEAESVESIADGIVQLATRADLRQQLVDASRPHIATFTWQRSAGQLRETYERVLA